MRFHVAEMISHPDDPESDQFVERPLVAGSSGDQPVVFLQLPHDPDEHSPSVIRHIKICDEEMERTALTSCHGQLFQALECIDARDDNKALGFDAEQMLFINYGSS